MIFAFLTALLFAVSAATSTRLTTMVSTISANFWRLLLAAILLALIAMLVEPGSLHPAPFGWLFLSGVIGFGIGDIALFLAYPRIGSRLTILINFCLATLCGAFADWIWLGDTIRAAEWPAVAAVFAGLAIALLARPARGAQLRIGSHAVGVVAALVAGLGQGFGASISRHAERVADAEGVAMGGISVAAQRVFAGLCCVALVYLWRRTQHKIPAPTQPIRRWSPWLLGAVLCGPVIGVSCFQQALMEVGNSGVVMAVVATSPLILIPLAWAMEGDRPTRLSLAGAVIGVGGVAALALLRS